MADKIILATKTLEAISAKIYEDQGVAFRGHLQRLYPLASDVYNQDNTPFRSHLGASLIGRKCGRELWYGFRWTVAPKFSGQMIRLFNRGHAEEPRFVAMLLTIGCRVWQFDQLGKQFKIADVYGHFGGSLDGVATGVPDIPIGEPCLTEFKTHNEKSFEKLVKNGVKEAKNEHYVQMQVYMAKMKLIYGLYMAVNKNTDELYAEIVMAKPEVAEQYIKRAYNVITTKEALGQISKNPAWFECKFCDYAKVCHGKDLPAKNCRTCRYSEPLWDGSKLWSCSLHNTTLDVQAQLAGCGDYDLNEQIKKPMK